jgi:hypothetical protein
MSCFKPGGSLPAPKTTGFYGSKILFQYGSGYIEKIWLEDLA